jgi:DNA-binding beta-propeller fold protein YncE
MNKVLLIITVILAGNILPAAEPSLELQEVWACLPLLETPESVIYDPVDSLIYVSNIAGNPLEADGNGFISKLDLNGNIIELQWITGLNAPKGLAIEDRILYVTDLTELVEISIQENRIIDKYPFPDAKLLNDIAIDNRRNIYVSETTRDNDTIYRFTAGKVEKWHKSEAIKRPNGLYVDGNILLVGSSGTKTIVAVDLEKNEVIDKVKVNSLIDGLAKLDASSYIFSDWYGRIFHLKGFSAVEQLADLIPLQQNTADLFYARHLKLLLVPTFFNDRIIAYKVLNKS